jgi:nucleotide-binding universal stress UspA family protein
MHRFRKLLVGTSLSEHDKSLFHYAGMLSRLNGTKELHFLHAMETVELPEEILKEYLQFQVLDSAARKERMEESARTHFPGLSSFWYFFETQDGVPSDSYLSYILQNKLDLAVVCKNTGDRQSLKLSERLARKAPCSVLCVPPESHARISRIMVAVDFSDHSRDALVAALDLAKMAGIGEILCVHVCQVPLRYTRTGSLYEEYEAITRRHAEESLVEFLRPLKPGRVTIESRIEQDDTPSTCVKDVAEREEVDLLVVGARGRSAGAAILLGSVTERLIHITDCPLLAVQRKGEGLGLLKALFS